MTKPRKKTGRPALGDRPSVQLAIRFPPAMIDAIDAIAAERLDSPDRAALIRELLAEAIAARRRRR